MDNFFRREKKTELVAKKVKRRNTYLPTNPFTKYVYGFCLHCIRIMKMLRKRCKFSGISFSTRLACLYFLPIIIIIITTTTIGLNPTTASSLPRPRGIAAISLKSLSQADFVAAATVDSNDQQQEEQTSAQPQIKYSEGVKCKTEQGTDVDWFIAYKLPKIRTSSNSLVRAGLAYAYILPSVTEDTFPSKTTAAATTTARPSTKAETQSVTLSNEENASGQKDSAFRGGQDNLNNNRTADAKKNEDGNLVTAPILPAPSAFSTRKNTSRASKSSPTAAWTLSNIGIDSTASMVGKTVAKLYEKGNQDVAFLTYNDQPPVGPTVESGGHSKGIIVTSLASGGIWIQHSVPHFPLIDPNNYHYQYPGTGKSNGQVFHCISFSSTKDVDDLAKIFDITRPHVVNSSFPTDSFKAALPQLLAIANRGSHVENSENSQFVNNLPVSNQPHHLATGGSISSAALLAGGGTTSSITKEVSQLPCLNEIDERACPNGTLSGHKTTLYNKKNQEAATVTSTTTTTPTAGLSEKKKNWDLLEIRSAGGKKLRAYVKGPSFGEDIYSSWIAPTNKVKLNVQSWLNGPHPFESNCTVAQYSVYNILDKRITEQAFSTHNDHSKWALSLSANQPLVCISDLNRMEHQLKRGGVTVCFADVAVWTTFSNSIIDVQPCPRQPGVVSTTVIRNDGNGTEGRERDNIPFTPISSSLFPATISVEHSRLLQVGEKEKYDDDEGSSTMVNTLNVIDVEDQERVRSRTTRRNRRQHDRIRAKFQRKVKSRTYSSIAI